MTCMTPLVASMSVSKFLGFSKRRVPAIDQNRHRSSDGQHLTRTEHVSGQYLGHDMDSDSRGDRRDETVGPRIALLGSVATGRVARGWSNDCRDSTICACREQRHGRNARERTTAPTTHPLADAPKITRV
jgi:hypothetical protein